MPVIASFFIGDYSGYLKESVKYFLEKKNTIKFLIIKITYTMCFLMVDMIAIFQ